MFTKWRVVQGGEGVIDELWPFFPLCFLWSGLGHRQGAWHTVGAQHMAGAWYTVGVQHMAGAWHTVGAHQSLVSCLFTDHEAPGAAWGTAIEPERHPSPQCHFSLLVTLGKAKLNIRTLRKGWGRLETRAGGVWLEELLHNRSEDTSVLCCCACL